MPRKNLVRTERCCRDQKQNFDHDRIPWTSQENGPKPKSCPEILDRKLITHPISFLRGTYPASKTSLTSLQSPAEYLTKTFGPLKTTNAIRSAAITCIRRTLIVRINTSELVSLIDDRSVIRPVFEVMREGQELNSEGSDDQCATISPDARRMVEFRPRTVAVKDDIESNLGAQQNIGFSAAGLLSEGELI